MALNLESISKILVKWFDPEKRDLPWRTSKDPYHVWISEIMLQQTTSQAVRSYFEKFIKNFPTVASLAKATQEEVYEHWQGLGYYSRARNILKTANLIVTEHQGHFPRLASELIALPGVGPYTSRAISSIAFNQAVGVVDGNVLRVHNRLLGAPTEWWKKDFFNSTQEFSDTLAKLQNPALSNQALMDLGATICTPKNPTCLICPFVTFATDSKTKLKMIFPFQNQKKPLNIGSMMCLKTHSQMKPCML